MPGAERRCPDDHLGTAGRQQPHGSGLLGVRGVLNAAPAHLDVRTHADAELNDRTGVPPTLLLRPKAGVVEQLERPVGGGAIVTDVVGQPARGGVREVGDPVEPSQLDRVDLELGGQLVEDPLDREGSLRAPRTAVGTDRSPVRVDARAAQREGVEAVDARVHVGPTHRRPGTDLAQVGAHIGDQPDLETEQPALRRGGHRNVLHEHPAVTGRGEILAARPVPGDRAAEPPGGLEDDEILHVRAIFPPKPPPTSGATTRSNASGIPAARASS